jgi:hypothetical protein
MKMLRSIGIAILVATSALSAFGQSWSTVKNSQQYYWGEGWGKSVAEADQQALSMLISQINVNIAVSSQQQNDRKENNGKLLSDNTTFKAAINTYSQATLDSTSIVIIEPAPKAHVGRWISKANVGKLFDSRKAKIHELVEAAERAEQKGKVDVALKDWYWALSLLKSLPRANAETYNNHLLSSWIPERMDDLLSDVEISVGNQTDNDIELNFTYKGKPVTSIDYTYSDGGFWSNLCSAKDGVGLVQLSPGTPQDLINVELEFEYRGQAMLDPEIQSVLQVIPSVKLAKASKFVKNDEANHLATTNSAIASSPNEPTPASAIATSFTDIEPEFFQTPQSFTSDEYFDTAMSKIVAAIRNRSLYNEIKQYFTDEGLATYNKLIGYGNAKVIGTPSFSYMPDDGATTARGLRLSFSFHNGIRRNFTEDIVFTFDANNKINNVAFGLGNTTQNDILGQSAYPENIRKLLVAFLENYQTAFALSRWDYLEKIFDDDAIIIVGNIVKQASSKMSGENYYFRSNPIIQYNRYSKQDYLDRLKTSMHSKEFINLRFNNTQVKKAASGGEIYGIQLEQDYYSSNYSDHGYLFLELNLNDMQNPLIMIRTWQPLPDKDFGIYDIDNFPIQRFDL